MWPVLETVNYPRLSPNTFLEEIINISTSKPFCMICMIVIWTLSVKWRMLTWNYFKPTFWALINKHAPMRRLRVSGKDSPWFNESLSSSARERDNTCAKAKRMNDPRDWVHYRALRNKCTKLIKKKWKK